MRLKSVETQITIQSSSLILIFEFREFRSMQLSRWGSGCMGYVSILILSLFVLQGSKITHWLKLFRHKRAIVDLDKCPSFTIRSRFKFDYELRSPARTPLPSLPLLRPKNHQSFRLYSANPRLFETFNGFYSSYIVSFNISKGSKKFILFRLYLAS